MEKLFGVVECGFFQTVGQRLGCGSRVAVRLFVSLGQLLLVEREPDAHLRAEDLPASRGGTLLVYLGLVFVQRIDAVAGRNLADVESGFPQRFFASRAEKPTSLGT